MKLVDSVLKEAQRLKPVTSATMSRVATRLVTLTNGLQLQRGERCAADLGSMYDPVIYENPPEFNGYRFARMRGEPGLDSQSHLVSMSPSHLGFGHRRHAFKISIHKSAATCTVDWLLSSTSARMTILLNSKNTSRFRRSQI
ncbi:cytochrome p450 monooxygenase [Colletotrichum sojae]|uniref:Cytochrome p450 monooxygenase n=1 Tax=Colletotrichum sojae TaxID=2175907 RepID=A0A8H6MWC1_9PEZI|nr:cytochrome p450 monooxygenase [Colletotrichum sojae]